MCFQHVGLPTTLRQDARFDHWSKNGDVKRNTKKVDGQFVLNEANDLPYFTVAMLNFSVHRHSHMSSSVYRTYTQLPNLCTLTVK